MSTLNRGRVKEMRYKIYTCQIELRTIDIINNFSKYTIKYTIFYNIVCIHTYTKMFENKH